MSSHYSQAELEAMRLARIKAQINNFLTLTHEKTSNVSEKCLFSDVKISTNHITKYDAEYQANEVISVEKLNQTISVERNENFRKSQETQMKEMDFSDLLYAADGFQSELEMEFDSWVLKVEERHIIDEKDLLDKNRILRELTDIREDNGIDIEDKISMAKMRVLSYLQSAQKISDDEIKEMNQKYVEYCALCEMLDKMPTEILPSRIEDEVNRMISVLEKRKQQEYVMDVIEDCLGKLGCNSKGDAVLNHTEGMVFSFGGDTYCDVFVGKDESGIMFEPIGDSHYGSEEELRQMEESAGKVCSMYKELEELATEQGVFFHRVYAEPVSIEEMYVQSDLSRTNTENRRRQTIAEKQREM